MSKIKISELAKELGVEGKEVVSFLQDKGVESAKRTTSSVEDDDAEKARKHFGKNNGSNASKDSKPSNEESDKAKKESKAVDKASEDKKSETEAKEDKNTITAEKTSKAAQSNDQPKKKKKIIIVSNQGNARGNSFASSHQSSGQNQSQKKDRPDNQRNRQGKNGQNSRNGSFASSQNVYHPIKPKTAPSQLEYESNIRKTEEKPVVETVKPQAAPAETVKPAAKENAPKVQENAAPKAEAEVKKPSSAETKAADNNQAPANRENHDNRNAGNQNRNSDDRRQGQNRNDRNDRNDRNFDRNGQGQNRNDRNGQGRNDRNDRNDRNGQGGGRSFDRNGQGRRNFDRNGQGSRPGQGGMNSRPSFDRNGQGGGRSFDRNSQGGRSSQGRGGQGAGFGAAPEAPIEKTNRHNDRRFDKDKKTKKDYEEEEMPRSKRVGRFIKPEVKKEEEPVEQIKTITIPESLTIKELAEKMKMQPSVIIKKLFLAGQIVTVNTALSYEEAENIAIEYDIICEKEVQVDVIEELLKEDEEDEKDLVSRAPVVCVMGHVDHGKTSLLDKIRDSAVTEKEAGGITQKIGAYMVSVKDRKVTFLDTPGHEAFTAMRMRGANSTDIAVLVVAADDGVMPQTIEAINHAKAANIEIIVAVNKIDKPSANIDRVKQELTEYGLIATDWGGSTEFVPVSAKTGEGIDTLLETIILTADILELKANPNRTARGLVLEAKLDKGRGPVANVLVQKGTLHVGDFISAGASSGRVRAMADDKGRRVKEATPSQPVEILGLSDVPNAGEVFIAHDSDKEAKQYASIYMQQHKKDLIEETKAKMSLDDLYSKIEEGKLKELDIIIKADVQGSVEALKASLMKLSNEEVMVKIIHGGVGAITESDVSLASASNAIIIGFDVRPDATAKSMAEHEGVEIKLYKVIYQAIDDVEAALKGMLAPVYEEKITGHAEVRQIFKASSIGNIAGSFILDGVIQKGCKVRVRRGDEQIFEGDLKSLKRFKDDVKEVKEGYECGLVFDGFDGMNVGDNIEAYIMVEVPRD